MVWVLRELLFVSNMNFVHDFSTYFSEEYTDISFFATLDYLYEAEIDFYYPVCNNFGIKISF